MYPISYKKKILLSGETVVNFYYAVDDMFRWVSEGKKSGTVGCILVGFKGPFSVYRCYGTLEHPCTEEHTIMVKQWEALDGPRQDPEWYLKDAAEKRMAENAHPNTSFKFVFLK